ncbi:hypothetical protein BCR44DRAFT_1443539 [Catenaria anguillulae PL171]|uniref:Uncharacterized protein n=1 Tax=Catenaria anguillulae PL171 TaxID=765915 RepID=A0A1Y2H8P5_9FUNG|nr:hypothetical protein BCR44DRAFT_1443539 [Catenaria anguillulae PL171]
MHSDTDNAMDSAQCTTDPALEAELVRTSTPAPLRLHLLDLPDDILLSILHRYCSRRDSSRFARTEKRSLPLARSVLYTRLVVSSLRTFPAVLQALCSSDAIAHCVRELVFLEPMTIDPIQASGVNHGYPTTWFLPAWILAFIQAAPSAWHVDLSLASHDILAAFIRTDCILQHLLPVLSKRKMTLSLPRRSKLLTFDLAPRTAAAGTVLALERVDFAHSKCTAIVALGHGDIAESRNGSASPPLIVNGSPKEDSLMRVEGAGFQVGSDSPHARLGRLNQRCDAPPMINLPSVVSRVCATELIAKLPAYGGGKLASLSCLTLQSVSTPIPLLVANVALHLPHLDSLTLIDLNTPLEPTLAAVDFLIRRPQPYGRALCKLKIAGIFDYLPPSESSTRTQHVPPPYPLNATDASAPPPALTHLILHRKSPTATASHQSQTSRVRPRLLLSRALLRTLHTLSINELDIVVSLPTPHTAQHVSLLPATLRGPLAPFDLLSSAALPNLHALRIDVQNLDLDGNLLPQSAPLLECLVAQNLAGDFSRAVAVVDLLATYPRLSHVWLDKNLWLPIAQVHKLGQVLFASARPPTSSSSPKKRPSTGPRSRLARAALPHLDRIVIDNAHAQCLVGGCMGGPLELPDPPVVLGDDGKEYCMAGAVEAGVGAVNISQPQLQQHVGMGFADGGGMDMETSHGFRPVALDAALKCREWIEQVYHLV